MMREREISTELSNEKNRKIPDDIMVIQEKGIDFLGENLSNNKKIKTVVGGGGFDETASFHLKKESQLGSQELTLSYLCDTSKLGISERDVSGQNLLYSLDKMSNRYNKGKEIAISEDYNQENGGNMWVERDFLQLSEERGNSSKREADNVETEGDNREKKPKVESLNLSLALPEVSLSLAGSNRVQNGDYPSQLRPSRSVQSLGGPSYQNTTTSFSTDFTSASLSYTCSHPFSHNPSCSLTRNSTENYEYSMGSHRREGGDQIWNAGEGTNGSVHSRFRPLGDGSVALSNPGGGLMNRAMLNKDLGCNNISLHKTMSSDNASFLPSELPARPRVDAQLGDSRRRNLENLRESEDLDLAKTRKFSRILREIVSESIPVMAQTIQEITDETVESVKEYLRTLISNSNRKDELESLQRRLERRSDLTNETLSKCQKSQLEVLVAIKMGHGSFLNSKNQLQCAELVQIFMLERCRNINCKRLLPVDDCDCKICSTKKGFCSECMCPVCFNFDSATRTCSWVGCDVCSHWCHAECGLKRNLIKPGPSLKGPRGTSEMQFHCLGCDHTSEMFGFVKDVFMSCAKDWGSDTLVNELECVRKMFAKSEDRKGKELHMKADEMIVKLQNKMITPSEVCSFIFQFFTSADKLLDLASTDVPSKDLTGQPSFAKNTSSFPSSKPVTPQGPFYDSNSVHLRQDSKSYDLGHQASIMGNKIVEDEWSVKPIKRDSFNSKRDDYDPTKRDGFNKKRDDYDSLDSLIRIKEAEAKMFQNKADEARREIESYKHMMRINNEKLEEEYAQKLAKLCLQETEERRREKLEELKVLENSHCDYYKMKLRMQSEISGLLKRMEATKQQLV